jgi:hypothetical protein
LRLYHFISGLSAQREIAWPAQLLTGHRLHKCRLLAYRSRGACRRGRTRPGRLPTGPAGSCQAPVRISTSTSALLWPESSLTDLIVIGRPAPRARQRRRAPTDPAAL